MQYKKRNENNNSEIILFFNLMIFSVNLFELIAWDKVGIPLQLRGSQLNNLKTTYPFFIKIKIGFPWTVLK